MQTTVSGFVHWIHSREAVGDMGLISRKKVRDIGLISRQKVREVGLILER